MVAGAQGRGSWVGNLQRDFEWLRKYAGEDASLLEGNDIVFWRSCVLGHPAWRDLVVAATKACRGDRQRQAHAGVRQKQWVNAAQEAGVEVPLDIQERLGVSARTRAHVGSEARGCNQCGKFFGTSRGLATHATKRHGHRAKGRYFASGSVCPRCLTDFQDRYRLVEHYRATLIDCLRHVEACFPARSEEQVAREDADTAAEIGHNKRCGWWSGKALVPAVRLAGCPIPAAGTEEAALMHRRWMKRSQGQGDAYARLQPEVARVEVVAESPRPEWEPRARVVMQSAGGNCRGRRGEYELNGLSVGALAISMRSQVCDTGGCSPKCGGQQ